MIIPVVASICPRLLLSLNFILTVAKISKHRWMANVCSPCQSLKHILAFIGAILVPTLSHLIKYETGPTDETPLSTCKHQYIVCHAETWNIRCTVQGCHHFEIYLIFLLCAPLHVVASVLSSLEIVWFPTNKQQSPKPSVRFGLSPTRPSLQ